MLVAREAAVAGSLPRHLLLPAALTLSVSGEFVLFEHKRRTFTCCMHATQAA
jgi:uncharacterized membrane protein YhhN